MVVVVIRDICWYVWDSLCSNIYHWGNLMYFSQALNKCAYYFSIACHRIGISSNYVYRDPPSKVVDGIYIGSIATACDGVALGAAGIDSIVNLSGMVVSANIFVVDLVMEDEPITPKTFPSFVHEFSRGLDAISAARAKGYNVLVNCAAGINRSATLIGLWMIVGQRMTYHDTVDALETANKRRGLPVLTNLSFRDFLLNAYVICSDHDRRQGRRRALPSGAHLIVY